MEQLDTLSVSIVCRRLNSIPSIGEDEKGEIEYFSLMQASHNLNATERSYRTSEPAVIVKIFSCEWGFVRGTKVLDRLRIYEFNSW